jgi:hypothetical protein
MNAPANHQAAAINKRNVHGKRFHQEHLRVRPIRLTTTNIAAGGEGFIARPPSPTASPELLKAHPKYSLPSPPTPAMLAHPQRLQPITTLRRPAAFRHRIGKPGRHRPLALHPVQSYANRPQLFKLPDHYPNKVKQIN